jgi:hypothetical protein
MSSGALTTIAGARGGIAPIMLLDVVTHAGYSYHWASRPIASASAIGAPAVFTGNPPPWNAQHLMIPSGSWDDTYLPWLLSAGPFHLSRSTQTDIGNFTVQNVSGDTLQRDVSAMFMGDAFENALFAFREWNLEAQLAEFEFHGTLSLTNLTEVMAEFAATQIFDMNNDEAADVYSEICAWRYASAACGDTSGNPCLHSWPTCRIPPRFHAVLNIMPSTMIPSDATISTRLVVRRRQV